MHTFSSRANAILTFGVVVLIVAACLSHLTSYHLRKPPTGTGIAVNSKTIYVVAAQRRGFLPPGDEANFLFDLDIDLTPVWTWNTKVLFVYLTAEYTTESNVVNQVVFWDRIITKKKDAHLTLKSEQTEYGIQDQGWNLKGRNLNITFSINEMPITGLLNLNVPFSETLQLPVVYTR
uniref:Signal peptidase complex subunit 3 n=1 Tax=Arcella intermedia TaxID=1963864 RepID=A0A6B2LLZ5_9EUKA